MNGLFKKIIRAAKASLCNPYFGFVLGHSHLGNEEWQRVREYEGVKDDALVLKFERRFAALIGDGGAVSYAAARMGFFHLMKRLPQKTVYHLLVIRREVVKPLKRSVH